VTAARDRLAGLLAALSSTGSFSARRTAPPHDLRLDVRGVGRIDVPISATQVHQLRALARPARFGQGERTLLDPRVRDTYEVPKTRVKVDQRQWRRTLGPVLAGLAADLGLPRECSLEAEFHAMLVYGPGQFFAPHQDSEKSDEMIGTLVVMLPSDAKGGVLQVDHGGTSVSYRGSKTTLTFVAFYADCRHQVKPVISGYRIVLTYNLLLRGDTSSAGHRQVTTELVDALAGAVREHFATPVAGHYGQPDGEPPLRLVYLLDHEYTEHGLDWRRLKGLDAVRASAVAAAAEVAGCEAVLALTEVHEIWDAQEPWQPRSRWHRWSYDDEDDDPHNDEPSPNDYELIDLIDSDVHLIAWLDQSGGFPTPITLAISEAEVCAATPSKDLTPYESEYQGYMGNYGNTMDRWYRRAAVVLWPRQMAFAVRAQASPEWALDTLAELLKAGDASGARERASTLASRWGTVTGAEQPRGFVTKALRVAQDLDDPELAAILLAPLSVETLTRAHAPALGRLATSYGVQWTNRMVSTWFGRPRPYSSAWTPERANWVLSLPVLCESMRANDGGAMPMSRSLTAAAWSALSETLAGHLRTEPPSERDRELRQVGPAVAAVLASAAITEDTALRDRVLAFLRQDNEPLTTLLMSTLRSGASMPAERREAAGLDAIAGVCAERLAARLARPLRAADDWSLTPPDGCVCPLCTDLDAFLADSRRRVFEWPLAEAKRRHIHERIDRSELPVLHTTRRKGSPYTLVLTKTAELFVREEQQRRRDQADLTWLSKTYFPSRAAEAGARPPPPRKVR
jgi:hypothetical protein